MNPINQIKFNELYRSDKIGQIAQWALEEEVLLAPKPGLVDSNNTGAHRDLSVDLMMLSAKTLSPYFSKMATVSRQLPLLMMVRHKIGQIGRDAEAAMMLATGGVNTHRGAIWALGLLSAATSRHLEHLTAEKLCEIAGDIANLEDVNTPITFSKGKVACQKYKIHGAKKEAQLGFPSIVNLALPALRLSRLNGDNEQAARLNALMAIMTNLSDTCVLSRSGISGLHYMQNQAKRIIALGGVSTTAGFNMLLDFGTKMEELNASPGGAADLLAATLFVDALEKEYL